MSWLSGSVEPESVDIVTDLKKTLSNKIFAHLRPSSFFSQPMVRKNSTKIKPKNSSYWERTSLVILSDIAWA